MKIKHNDLFIKDLDVSKREVQAYYSNYGSIDSDMDIIAKGAYNKSIAERGPGSAKPRIKHLLNHWDAAGEVKEMGEDDKGGWFVSKLGRHTVGKDTMLMYEDGIITEHSHGFEVVKSSMETRDGEEIRVIQEGVLWEVTSLDKWGANMNTGIKSLDDMRVWHNRIDKLIKALKKGEYSDERMELFEIQLKQIQELLKDFEPGVQSTFADGGVVTRDELFKLQKPEQTTHSKKRFTNINFKTKQNGL